MSEYLLHCSHCGAEINEDDNAGNCEIVLCRNCFRHHYTECNNCGRIIRIQSAYYLDDGDEDESLCLSCYEEAQRCDGILNYYFKPTPHFLRRRPSLYGSRIRD